MIKKFFVYILLFLVFSCSNVEFMLSDNNQTNPLKNKTILLIDKNSDERFVRGLYTYFGNKEKYEYILKTNFLEKKENRIVKNNQVAEKIEYTIEVFYSLFYKTNECEIFNKKVTSKFSFTPKSAGYNFGSERSFEKLYNSAVDQNIDNFINSLQINKNCLK